MDLGPKMEASAVAGLKERVTLTGVTRFRYRTKALKGQWRTTREDAVADAIKAGQVVANAQPENQGWWVEQEGNHIKLSTISD